MIAPPTGGYRLADEFAEHELKLDEAMEWFFGPYAEAYGKAIHDLDELVADDGIMPNGNKDKIHKDLNKYAHHLEHSELVPINIMSRGGNRVYGISFAIGLPDSGNGHKKSAREIDGEPVHLADYMYGLTQYVIMKMQHNIAGRSVAQVAAVAKNKNPKINERYATHVKPTQVGDRLHSLQEFQASVVTRALWDHMREADPRRGEYADNIAGDKYFRRVMLSGGAHEMLANVIHWNNRSDPLADFMDRINGNDSVSYAAHIGKNLDGIPSIYPLHSLGLLISAK